jgi:hypothetical protein
MHNLWYTRKRTILAQILLDNDLKISLRLPSQNVPLDLLESVQMTVYSSCKQIERCCKVGHDAVLHHAVSKATIPRGCCHFMTTIFSRKEGCVDAPFKTQPARGWCLLSMTLLLATELLVLVAPVVA